MAIPGFLSVNLHQYCRRRSLHIFVPDGPPSHSGTCQAPAQQVTPRPDCPNTDPCPKMPPAPPYTPREKGTKVTHLNCCGVPNSSTNTNNANLRGFLRLMEGENEDQIESEGDGVNLRLQMYHMANQLRLEKWLTRSRVTAFEQTKVHEFSVLNR